MIKDWDNFIELSYKHGVFPLVYNTIKNFQESIPKDIFRKMKFINMDIVKQNMLMTSELLKVTKLLEENDIKAISFKGPVLSQMAYGDITLRQYVDLDILVVLKDINKVGKLLLKENYKEVFDLEEYQKENLVDIVHDRSFLNKINNVLIEAHWTLSSAEFFLDLEKLNYFDSQKYKLKNSEINILSNEIHFIYLCIHGYKHIWERLEWLVDINLMIVKEIIDLKKVLSLSEKIDADRVVLSSILLCERVFSKKIDINLENYDKKIIENTNKIYDRFIKDFEYTDKIHTKEISSVQWFMLKNTSYRWKYLKSMLHPTEYDYRVIKLPKSLNFLYYVIRPFNIILKKFKK